MLQHVQYLIIIVYVWSEKTSREGFTARVSFISPYFFPRLTADERRFSRIFLFSATRGNDYIMVINAESTSTDEDPASEHSKPSVRLCKVDRNESGSCGFHLTRTKWDPYPWIAGVDEGSPAQGAGLKIGDCVLEVNGEDVLGLRVGEIANKVQTTAEFVSMLLWNAGGDPKCKSEVSRQYCMNLRSILKF